MTNSDREAQPRLQDVRLRRGLAYQCGALALTDRDGAIDGRSASSLCVANWQASCSVRPVKRSAFYRRGPSFATGGYNRLRVVDSRAASNELV